MYQDGVKRIEPWLSGSPRVGACLGTDVPLCPILLGRFRFLMMHFLS